MQQVYFIDIDHVIYSNLALAKSRIYIVVSWFTNNVLFDELNKALQRSVDVKLLILDDILNRNKFGLDYGLLANNGAEVRFAGSKIGTMHNKFLVIDEKVITGSCNWTFKYSC